MWSETLKQLIGVLHRLKSTHALRDARRDAAVPGETGENICRRFVTSESARLGVGDRMTFATVVCRPRVVLSLRVSPPAPPVTFTSKFSQPKQTAATRLFRISATAALAPTAGVC